ncbi:TlpA family protein disulfide reductase [Fimbriimonas ginsengisoli]|uniref:Redoxin domain-containing protein n=1 Tax=Fimbriimonas ginsengisoli Gsoil 348 TaxID=661478 RepID=A0A068NW64_FIMGI|nr:TlpA disulfide reductase family protein [Fimbriimonas ginsengisoli]AIE87010.1 redoxin domain-containing protein [Fimbriimonas ginsengisoli Gsoil 348]
MVRFLRASIGLGIVIAVLGCSENNPLVGKDAPDVKLAPIKAGGDVSLKDLKGKVVLLDFWATWCGPCRQLMPTIVDMKSKYGPKGLEVLGVTAEDRAPVLQFRREHPEVNYDLYLDPAGIANTLYKVEGLPTTVIIGRDGKVVFWDAGFGGDSHRKIADAVAAAMANG